MSQYPSERDRQYYLDAQRRWREGVMKDPVRREQYLETKRLAARRRYAGLSQEERRAMGRKQNRVIRRQVGHVSALAVNSYARWSPAEERALVTLYGEGRRAVEIAIALSRPLLGVKNRITRLRKEGVL